MQARSTVRQGGPTAMRPDKRLVTVAGLEGGPDRLGDQLLSVAALGFQTLLVVTR